MNIISELNAMNLKDLRVLKNTIDTMISLKSAMIVGEMKVGDMVKINHRKTVGMKFIIKKINRKKVIVQKCMSTLTYTVGMSLIEKF